MLAAVFLLPRLPFGQFNECESIGKWRWHVITSLHLLRLSLSRITSNIKSEINNQPAIILFWKLHCLSFLLSTWMNLTTTNTYFKWISFLYCGIFQPTLNGYYSSCQPPVYHSNVTSGGLATLVFIKLMKYRRCSGNFPRSFNWWISVDCDRWANRHACGAANCTITLGEAR